MTAPASTTVGMRGREHRPGDDAVVVVIARTPTERELVQRWAHNTYPGAPLTAVDDPALVRRLDGDGDPLVVPVRVAWLPRERDGDRSVRVADLLALTNPRQPWSRMQPRIARREPDRARVLAGEPARAGELRQRFEEQTGGGGDGALAAFVGRQAVLACDRAERAIIGDRYKVPRLVAEHITASARFREEVARLAEELGRPAGDVLADAEGALRELATVQSPVAVDVFRIVLSPMHARAWTVEVDVGSLERLRQLNKRHALVFLPSHRSYVDPLVLGDVLHRHDFPPNHVVGGDNMAFFPIGPLGRRAGVIFIRRNFGDDKIYKLAIRELLGHVVAKRFNLEWYMEGGRTRTGKLRPPHYGLLHYLVHAVEHGRAEDVQLVPVSIVYEQMQEVTAIAAEDGGAAKRREGVRWFVDYVRRQRRNVGTARVTFGEPFSLRGALDEAGDGPARLEKVAFAVCEGINRATPMTGSSLVTFALLGARDRALTLGQVQRVTAPLLGYTQRRGIPGPIAGLRRLSALGAALDALVDAGVASRFDGGDEPVWSIAPGGHHVAAFYRNGAIHWLVNRAIVELVLLRAGDVRLEGDAFDAAWEDALALRDLLKFEFFFADKARFRDELSCELELVAPAAENGAGAGPTASEMLAGAPTLLANRVLRPFLEAQLVVARRLAQRDPRRDWHRRAFLEEAQGYGRQLLLQGQVHNADAVSRELFGAAIKLAANRDLVNPGGDEVQAARDAYVGEVEEVIGRLARLGELDAALLQEVLHGDAG